jgi:alpha-tubulin suppressor-like RCC1 family protein
MSKVIIRQSAISDPSNAWAVINHADIYSQYSKVGIGKSPSVSLDVSGDLRVSGSLNPDNLIANDRWSSSNGSIIYNGGNVGIGKSNPASSIDISGSMSVTSNLTMTNSSLRVGGNLDVSNNVTLGLSSMTHTHSGNIATRKVTIPDTQRILVDSPFEISFDGAVNVLKFNSTYTKLYAGGDFTHVTVTSRRLGYSSIYERDYFCEIDCSSGIPTQNTTVSASVTDIAIDSTGNAYIAGSFTTVGDAKLSASYIAKWTPTTSSWSNIGTMNGIGTALAIDSQDRVYIGGNFTTITPLGGSTVSTGVNRIARYNPSLSASSALQSVSSPLTTAGSANHIRAMAIYNNILYVGGSFTSTISTVTYNQIVSYNIGTSTWVHMVRGIPSGTVVEAIKPDPTTGLIYVGGSFTSVNNSSNVAIANTSRIVIWNPTTTTWSGFIGTALNNQVNTIGVDASGRIYIGGNFTDVSGAFRDRIAIRNTATNQWEGVDAEVNSSIYTIAFDNKNNLFMGGTFTTIIYQYITSSQNSLTTLTLGYYSSYNITTRQWSDNLNIESLYSNVNDVAGKMTTGNITSLKGKLLVGKTSSSGYDSSAVSVDICGGIMMTGSILSVNHPYSNTLRVYDTNITDNTWSANMYNSFVYIDLSGRIVGNSYGANQGIFNTAGTVSETIFEISGTDASFVKVYNTTHNTFGITLDGRIYSCGSNDEGNCGIGTATGAESKLQRAFLRDASNSDISDVRFTKIVVSDNYIMKTIYALTTTGDLYACGANNDGQLADGGLQNTSSKTYKYPNLVTFNNQLYRGLVKDAVSVGRYYSPDGDITVYKRHSLCVLDKYGFVWCAGLGRYGQMGRGTTTEDNTTLQKVKINSTTELGDISAVYSFGVSEYSGFFALSNNGSLYMWGLSSSNHVFDGIAGNRDISYATLINSQFSNEPVSRIWTTSHDRYEIFVQTASGLIYGTGYGHALGINTTTNAGWKLIDFFNTTTKYVVQMYTDGGASTGNDRSSFAITRNINTNNYTLWGTGYNESGRLGNGNTTNQRTWIKVNLPSYIVKSIKRILHSTINSTNTTTVILLNSGRLIFAGKQIPLYNDATTVYSNFTSLEFSNTVSTTPN